MEKSDGGREFLGEMSEKTLFFLYIFNTWISSQIIIDYQHENGLKKTAYNGRDK